MSIADILCGLQVMQDAFQEVDAAEYRKRENRQRPRKYNSIMETFFNNKEAVLNLIALLDAFRYTRFC